MPKTLLNLNALGQFPVFSIVHFVCFTMFILSMRDHLSVSFCISSTI